MKTTLKEFEEEIADGGAFIGTGSSGRAPLLIIMEAGGEVGALLRRNTTGGCGDSRTHPPGNSSYYI